MSVIKYIGRTTDFRGNTLWDIVSNLKNFGVGRVVVRSKFERYEESSYFRILKVDALPTPFEDPKKIKTSNIYQEERKCIVLTEKVFRGRKYEKPLIIRAQTYKADFRLLSKKEEADYCKLTKREGHLINPLMEFPPLLKELVIKETGQTDAKMKVHYRSSNENLSRLAKEGETPTFEITMGIGKPHPKGAILYEGLKLD